MSVQDNRGNPPGKVTVPKAPKGDAPITKRFGEPSRQHGAGASAAHDGRGNHGNAPGVVRVPHETRGSHPRHHEGPPTEDGNQQGRKPLR